MTRTHRYRFAAVAVFLSFTVALATLSVLNSRSTRQGGRAVDVAAGRSAPAYAALGTTFLQRARETGDPGYYPRAEQVLGRALELDPDNVEALTGMGTLALGRHDFRAALRWGERARRAGPGVVRPLPVIVDAQIELGRYAAAGRELQRFVDLRPGLAAYARVSYYRELHGDLDGAVDAMRLAVSAGGEAGEGAAYVQSLLGDLELQRGRLTAAERAYRGSLAVFPGYPRAEAGLARVAAARGQVDSAVRRYRRVVARLPLPEHVIALGEVQLAAGRGTQAHRDLALIRVEERLLAANGVNTDVELAIFEAEHGSPRRALALSRRAWAAAPGVRSADAMCWALTRSGRPAQGMGWCRRALRLGSRDPVLLYHAGVTAKRAGEPAAARSLLRRALALNPRFSPLHAPRARRELEALT
jgi:tetratricopeptide (TPR) repeat protein